MIDFFTDMNAETETLFRLLLALALGLLIGAERGWEKREAAEGGRVAGFRTYGLIALLGGLAALLPAHLGEPGSLVFGLIFLGLIGAVTAGHVMEFRRDGDAGITSLIAAVLSFVFGALTMLGRAEIAVPAAVVTVLILSIKPALHKGLRAISEAELKAGLILLLMSLVLLPILPDRGFGPYGAVNPFELWWMVVLISAISFSGYLAMKWAGARSGAVLTGLFAGLASSTALTLDFSRSARTREAPPRMLAAGILIACTTMLPRMLIVAGLLNIDLVSRLFVPAAVMGTVMLAAALYHWRISSGDARARESVMLGNPLKLEAAFLFGGLLALVMLAVRALQDFMGDAGVYLTAAVSGLMDVDAITLSLSRMSVDDIALRTAAAGIIIGAAANTFLKGVMSAAIGGRQLALFAALPLFISALLGLIALYFFRNGF